MRQKINSINVFVSLSISFVSILLKGLGQIMLQENRLTGFLFLAGIFYGSIMMGFATIVATACGTAIAFLLKYNRSEIDKGLYGFSAALVGAALILFLKPVLWTWVFIVIGSALATILQHFFIKKKISAFTLPFVLITWLIVFIANNYMHDIMIDPVISNIRGSNYLNYAFKSYGQVIFQGSLISGIIFFIAVFINAPGSAVYALLCASLSSFIAFKFSIPNTDIYLGLYGYNAVLCTLVFAGKEIKDGIWVLVSVLLSLSISLLMNYYDLIQLTFPFVLASFLTLVLKNKFKNMYQTDYYSK